MEFSDALRRVVADVDRSSRSPRKYDKLRELFEESLGLAPILVKSLGDPKNYGNRISEATGHQCVACVLVGSEVVETEALIRAYRSRAINRIPVLLVAGESPEPVLALTTDSHPFGPDVPTHLIPTRDENMAPDVAGILGALLKFDGAALDERPRLDEILRLSRSRGVVTKHVGGDKNALNRVREAIGRRPTLLVLFCELHHGPTVERALRQQTTVVPTEGLVVATGPEFFRVTHVPKFESERSPPDKWEKPSMTHTKPTEYQVNRSVTELNRYLPFDAEAGNLYEEHVRGSQRLEFETKALAFVTKLVANPAVSMVVLTGNAGHGKTHLCRRLLTAAGLAPKEAMAAMSGDPLGTEPIEAPHFARPIKVVKDLSEVEPVEVAALRLEELLNDTGSLAVICANEGRLRHVVSTRKNSLQVLVETLEAGIQSGRTSVQPSAHVVNLNFQSVAPLEGSFLDSAIDHWTHGNRWKKCKSCLAKDSCPILGNRTLLSAANQKGSGRTRDSLAHLIRLAEQSGYVLTIREALILAAYLFTGGSDCEETATKHRAKELNGANLQHLLFERKLAPNELAQLGVLRRIRRFDPGKNAIRRIDERLHLELEAEGELGRGLTEPGGRPPTTRQQQGQEQSNHRNRIRDARRADFFSADLNPNSRSMRLGLRHHGDFLALQASSVEDSRMLAILQRLVAGLHVIQGIRQTGSTLGVLFLVDPAFSRSGNRAAVIAHEFRQRHLSLKGQAEFWRTRGKQPELLSAVDWLDRKVIVCHEPRGEAHEPLIELDLLQFEFVMRSAEGVVFREFNGPERRRIIHRLAHLAEAKRDDNVEEIRVMEGGHLRRLLLERDNSLHVVAN